MISDDWDEAEDDWDDESEVEQTGPCPECGAELHVDAETCYACGHWLTTVERHQLWDAGSPVRGVLGVGKIVLVMVLVALLSGFLFF